MNALLPSLLVCLMTTSLASAQNASSDQSLPAGKAKTRTAARHHAPAKSKGPTTADQLRELREMLESQQQQILQLQNQLAARDQRIEEAQQAADHANSKVADAAAKASEAQSTAGDARTQAASLRDALSAVKTNDQKLAETVQSEQKKVNEAVESPAAIHFKGITISPTGSYIEAATIWRQRGMGDDINTQFSQIPFSGSQNGNLSEFNATGRQSRIALLAEGKASDFTLRAYYETDWLSAGVTSNNNQTNSYTNRQRQLFGQVETAGGWIFTGGQMWSLATETKVLLDNRTENIPMVIDPQYTVGFTLARQYGARVVKDFGTKAAVGFSLEDPQTLNVGGGGLSGTTGPGVVYQIAGQTGGLFDNQANYSFNYFPDVIGKVAFEPGWGHYELFGIARFFRDRVYPNAGTKSVAGVSNLTSTGGGIGANLRVPTFHKKVDFGVHLLAGAGLGRYGSTALADVTFKPDGSFEPIRGGSTLGTMEIHPAPKLDVYFNYGMDYDQRVLYNNGSLGYGRPGLLSTGCNTEIAPIAGGSSLAVGPANCTVDTRNVQEFAAGYWYDFYKGEKGRVRQGIQYSYFTRDTWAGTGGSPSATDHMFWTSFRYYVP